MASSPEGHIPIRRPSLREVYFILPRTGERVKRALTLRNSPVADHERTPLLSRRNVDSTTSRHRSQYFGVQFRRFVQDAYRFAVSDAGQSILKCSLAYLVGSLATFLPYVAASLGKSGGNHVVATITVYFHPARSAGNMALAVLLALMAVSYAAFISFTSMAVSVFFRHSGFLTVGHVLVLIIFCGGGLGLVGWWKQKLGNPLVNVACSLTSLAIITVLTKEGAVQAATFSYSKVVQVLKMVIMGIIASTAVSLLIRPISARKNIRNNLRKATDSLGEMLAMITGSFLSGQESDLKHPQFLAASSQYASVFNSLTKNLSEAKYEHYILGTEKEYWIEARLVRCMERLSQSIGGLRSAATTQFALIASSPDEQQCTQSPNRCKSDYARSFTMSPGGIGLESRFSTLAAIDEVSETTSHTDNLMENSTRATSDTISPLYSPDMFSMFITHLGPPMRSLAYTLKEILSELPFGPEPKYEIAINNRFRGSLVQAIELFENSRREALTLLYKNKVLGLNKSIEMAANYEEVAASCGYFSSSLQDFAEDMLSYLDLLEELKSVLEPRRRSWTWAFFWRQRESRGKHYDSGSRTPRRVEDAEEFNVPEDIPIPERGNSSFQDPEKPVLRPTYPYRIWRTVRFLARDDIKYAIKTGVGAVLWAAWSFFPQTRPFYTHWRGEWGLLSYMLVCSMTIGASNTTGLHRILGTCLGAFLAIIACLIARENPYILAFLGWLVSMGCFYIIIVKRRGPMGRFILLTYNLSALYAYSLSVKSDEEHEDIAGLEIYEIILHRVVAVVTGCIWGIFITRVIWPISARHKLRNGICILWLRMGLIWKRDPLAMLLAEVPLPTSGPGSNISYIDIRESIELRRFLTYLETLRNSAVHEFEMKGPFPDQIYQRILENTGKMLDAFHAMKVVMNRDLKATSSEAEILRWTRLERLELSARISHLFSVLASSMKLEYPLNDAMPSTEHTRNRLLAKLFDFRKHAPGGAVANDEDFELLYAYALVTGQLAHYIERVGRDIELLYGLLDEDNLKLQ